MFSLPKRLGLRIPQCPVAGHGYRRTCADCHDAALGKLVVMQDELEAALDFAAALDTPMWRRLMEMKNKIAYAPPLKNTAP